MKNVLSIAGSDCSGGAGIQADLKTMCALGVYGMTVITAVTVQNTQKVYDVQDVDVSIIKGQIDAVFTDINVDAVKIGMVSDIQIIQAIRNKLIEYQAKNIVVDPVMVSKSGYRLVKEEAESEVKTLVSIADIVTPNIPEAEILANMTIKTESDMVEAAQHIQELGCKNVLLKGGHLSGAANDFLLTEKDSKWFYSERINTKNTHGTGCTLSSAIASHLAKGMSIHDAVEQSKKYVTLGIKNSLDIGKGVGPLGHLVDIYKKLEIMRNV